MVGLDEIFEQITNWDWDEIHYWESGFFLGLIIGWVSGWVLCAYFIKKGYGLRMRNWVRKRKSMKISRKLYKIEKQLTER